MARRSTIAGELIDTAFLVQSINFLFVLSASMHARSAVKMFFIFERIFPLLLKIMKIYLHFLRL